MKQSVVARSLEVSASYYSQLESNQRPLTMPLVVRISVLFGVDVEFFSEEEEGRLVIDMREALSSCAPEEQLGAGEMRELVSSVPQVARALIALHRRARLATERADALASRLGERGAGLTAGLPLLPYEEVRDFFYARHNYVHELDELANISKRQSATDFHFSRVGGTCPLWNVYEAFAQPGKVLRQVAQMPDGRTYLWIARAGSRAQGGFGTPRKTYAIALGCDLRHASRLIYARGLDLKDSSAATPIGMGCKVCERTSCPQRAFPPIGKVIEADERVSRYEPYSG
jgi:transcriptional regulator with XRE-family HTH domain